VPQLDVSTYASQIFWLILCFCTLYYLLSRFALPRIADVLEARQDRIAADLAEAQRLRTDAEAALARFEVAIAKAQDEAQSLLRDSQARAQAVTAERLGELDKALARQIADAEARIAAAKVEALAELDLAAVAIAQFAVEHLAGIKVSQKDAQSVLKLIKKEAA
jgi:F-type H+-transporting ATPase subunit b